MATITCNNCGEIIVYRSSVPQECPSCGASFEGERSSSQEEEEAFLIAQDEHRLFKYRPIIIHNGNQLAIKEHPITLGDINKEFCLSLDKEWGPLTKESREVGSLVLLGNHCLAPDESFVIGREKFVVIDRSLGISFSNVRREKVWVPLPTTEGEFTIGRYEVTDPVQADIILPDVSDTVHRRHVTLEVRRTGYGIRYGVRLSDFILQKYWKKKHRYNEPEVSIGDFYQILRPDTTLSVVEGTKIKLGSVILTVGYGE